MTIFSFLVPFSFLVLGLWSAAESVAELAAESAAEPVWVLDLNVGGDGCDDGGGLHHH
jgi:hypothetical protein